MTLRRRHGPANAMLFLTVLPITPLIDIALVLVVFALAGLRDGDQQGVPVALPQARTGAPASGTAVTVVVERSGEMRIDGRTVTLKDLAAVHAAKAVLRADAAVPHGRVVEAVDALRAAGVPRIYYATTPRVEEW